MFYKTSVFMLRVWYTILASTVFKRFTCFMKILPTILSLLPTELHETEMLGVWSQVSHILEFKWSYTFVNLSHASMKMLTPSTSIVISFEDQLLLVGWNVLRFVNSGTTQLRLSIYKCDINVKTRLLPWTSLWKSMY